VTVQDQGREGLLQDMNRLACQLLELDVVRARQMVTNKASEARRRCFYVANVASGPQTEEISATNADNIWDIIGP
jgi:hypothetical protein